MDTQKPGYLTTEFWVNVFTQIVGTIVSIAALFGHNLDGSKLQPLIGMAAMIGMGISAAWYAHGRSSVKAANANVTAAIAQMQTPTIPSITPPADPGVDPAEDLSGVDPGSDAAASMAQMGSE